jgi:serine O-acetyltransferase
VTLLSLLKADAARQLHFGGASDANVDTVRLLRMLPSSRFVPVVLYRLAHWCGRHHLRPLAKVFSTTNFVVFGLEIGIDCEIGPGLYFPHTVGTVIGASRIGARAVIYHNVTLGAKEPDLAYAADKRPELGDDVFVGSGAKVLGGLRLGDRSVVAANAVVVHSVPDGATVAGIPARIVKREGDAPDPERAR